MADYTQFRSENALYNFSKGPKSLYYAKGDEDLLGVVLNVPQTDDDDEWGGTNRIAFERIVDSLGEIQEIVIDPAGSGTGLADRVTNIETIVDYPNSTVTVGDITLTGATNTITVGTAGTELNATQLKLGSDFLFEPTPNAYTSTFKNVLTRWFDDDGATNPYFGITITDGVTTTYQFKANEFTVPSGVTFQATDLTITGTLTAVQANFTGAVSAVDFVASSYLEAATAYISGTSLFTGLVTICGASLASDSIIQSPSFTVPTDAGITFNTNTAPPGTIGGGRAYLFWEQSSTSFKYTDGTGIHDLGGALGSVITATDIIATSYLETVNLNALGSSALSGELTLCGNIKWLEPLVAPGGSPPGTSRFWYDDTLGGFKYVTSLATVYEVYSSASVDIVASSYMEAGILNATAGSALNGECDLCGTIKWSEPTTPPPASLPGTARMFYNDTAGTFRFVNSLATTYDIYHSGSVDIVASSYMEAGILNATAGSALNGECDLCGTIKWSEPTTPPPASLPGTARLFYNDAAGTFRFVNSAATVYDIYHSGSSSISITGAISTTSSMFAASLGTTGDISSGNNVLLDDAIMFDTGTSAPPAIPNHLAFWWDGTDLKARKFDGFAATVWTKTVTLS